MKKAFSVISVSLLSLTLLAACNQGESEAKKELAALKEQLAQQQKQQAQHVNEEQEHRRKIEQQKRENELYEQAYQNAQEDLRLQQFLEEEKKQEEEAKKKQFLEEERKREEVKKKQAQEEERKREEIKKKQALEEERKKREEAKKAAEKQAATQQTSKITEKLARYPAFVISESGHGSVNLRGAPSITAVSVTQLKDGQQLQVIAETNACTNAAGGCWVKVQAGGLTGYISNAYLQKGRPQDNGYTDTGY